ncbi:SDR family oxidoreductase [Mesorhizobium sp. YM1C-6-2]|uniref:SDR family oxidoreductase n=1 Tax=Mesorhizobium sp. YM1C-6-2 TaxID=1827501 RepID=UPI000EF25A11|nr:SDR family oxidoreductase [Mesorhizobium sp. YM1C-6-2]RLP27723.1 SDR family oxidoreductase [Mesorhizobium sp. YM1C-6-2]
MTSRFFILGAGYSAKAFAATRSDPTIDIAGTTRSTEKFDALRRVGIEPILFDGEEFSPDLLKSLGEATHLIVSISPEEGGDPVVEMVGGDLARLTPQLRWIGYLSTVGVYGNYDGGWVDETGQCRPVSKRSQLRLEAENQWLALGEKAGVPVAVLRLSGIYGPGRNALVNLRSGTAKRLIKPGQVFNRIHAADIAGALWHLAERDLGGVFNVTDDEPGPPQDVVTYAAGLMGVEPPPEIPFASAQLSPMARSFYGENKRVSNAALKGTGYRFRHPDYRSAFDAMWATGDWKGEGESDARSPMKR